MLVTDDEFERAASEHYRAVYCFALGLSRNEADACDLAQETFRLLSAKGGGIRESGRVKAWLMTTCYREFLRLRRDRLRHPQVELSIVAEELPAVAPEAGDAADAEVAMAALGEIEEVFRVPLLFFYTQGLSYKEIAEALEVPVGTVMSRLARGKDRLRQALAQRLAFKCKTGCSTK